MVALTFPSFEKEAPPFRIEPDGTVRIGNSRITLDLIIEAYQAGQTAEYIAEGYETVTLAEIYATIAYYLTHREQVDPYLKKREQEAEELRKMIEADPKNKAFAEKLRRLKAARKGNPA